MLIGMSTIWVALVAEAEAIPRPGMAVVYCGAMSLVGASIFYTRKLYKAIISDSYTLVTQPFVDQPPAVRLKRLGTFAFYIFRPVFGVAFAIMVYSIWRLSLSASGADQASPTKGFLYTTIAMGFLSGFLAGRILGMLEGYGNRQLRGILGTGEQ